MKKAILMKENYSTMQMLLAKRLSGLVMGVIFLVGFFVLLPATASAHSLNAQAASNAAKQSGACVAKGGARQCIAPTMKSLCPGKQWYDDTSHDGHSIGWTYTYGSRHCLTVTWDLSKNSASTLKGCTALIYIPAGHATAVTNYTTNNGKNASTLSQRQWGTNGVGEFIQIFGTGELGSSIQLTDQDTGNTGQAYHAAQIAWGTAPNYSLDLECP
jgi:hypothetical protein